MKEFYPQFDEKTIIDALRGMEVDAEEVFFQRWPRLPGEGVEEYFQRLDQEVEGWSFGPYGDAPFGVSSQWSGCHMPCSIISVYHETIGAYALILPTEGFSRGSWEDWIVVEGSGADYWELFSERVHTAQGYTSTVKALGISDIDSVEDYGGAVFYWRNAKFEQIVIEWTGHSVWDLEIHETRVVDGVEYSLHYTSDLCALARTLDRPIRDLAGGMLFPGEGFVGYRPTICLGGTAVRGEWSYA